MIAKRLGLTNKGLPCVQALVSVARARAAARALERSLAAAEASNVGEPNLVGALSSSALSDARAGAKVLRAKKMMLKSKWINLKRISSNFCAGSSCR